MAFLTPQQAEAVTRRGVSVVLSSGAGCGKTHVLTHRYLSHLETDGAEVGQLVAITFTERAARQMRDRIRRAVVEHVQNAELEAEVTRWERHLRGLETAQISTIHAFCGTLLRTHAVEAGLDPHFEILEDFLASNLEIEALTTCLQGLLTSSAPAGEDLRQLILLHGWRQVLEGVQGLLQQWDPDRMERWLERPAAEIAAEWQSFARGQFLTRYMEFLTTASPKIAGSLWVLRHTTCPAPRLRANIATVLELTEALLRARDLPEVLTRIREAARVQGTASRKEFSSAADYEAIKAALADLREELPARLQPFLESAEHLDEAIRAGQRYLRVTAETVRAYRQLKRRHSVLDFQDLLTLARALLRDQPQVRQRLQARFRFLLVDELQDTDPVQMELIELLCGADLTRGKLFAVGDQAQSIYRFRGAEVHLFQELRRRTPLEGRLGLTLNFRSQPVILDFTNALVGGALGDHEHLHAHHHQVNPQPCVEFLWSPGDGASATEKRQTEADWIARRIAAMVRNQERLVVQRENGAEFLRPVQPGDVVLLFRALTSVELYEAALRDHGLDYYLVGGRAFFAQQEIYDLLNLLRALENPQDAASLVGTLRSPFFCLSDEALFLLCRHPAGPWGGLYDPELQGHLPTGQRSRAQLASQLLGRWRTLKNSLALAQLLGTIFADSAYDAALQFEFLGPRKLANLWKLQEMARSFDRSGLFGLPEFIARLGDLVRNQPREEQAATLPENANVVRLMSIHQAKGLEFPVVFLPDIAARTEGGRASATCWHERLGCVVRPPREEPLPFPELGPKLWRASEAVEEYHEDLRTLYVACTRAQDYLVLSAAMPPDFTPTNTWTFQLAQRFELRTGRCLVPATTAEHLPTVLVTDTEPLAPPAPPRPTLRPTPPPRGLESGAAALAPAAWDGSQVFTVRELRRGQPRQWDAEEGADETAWAGPQEWLSSGNDTQSSLWRSVLRGWAFRPPMAWQNFLPPGQEELRTHLERFAGSELATRLREAQALRQEVEFQTVLAAQEESLFEQAPLRITGVVDVLWQDGTGQWHVLAWGAQLPAAAGTWEDAELELACAVLALREGGFSVATLGVYSWLEGEYRQRKATTVTAPEVNKWLWPPRGREQRRRVKPA